MENQLQRQLPVTHIDGTAFIVDVMHGQLRQQGTESNIMSFKDMVYLGSHYLVDFDRDHKNIATGTGNVSWDVRVEMMVRLDPEGMANRTGKPVAEIKDKTDFDLIIDQHLLDKRLKGELPVIDICGHPFYVDLFMGSLRPKDDFTTEGIRFNDIEGDQSPDGSHYRIVYDPLKHQPVFINWQEITAVPSGVVVIEIPTERQLDPVSYARLYDWDMKQMLMGNPIKPDMKAKVISWEKTGIHERIKENRDPKKQVDLKSKSRPKKRGRGI